MKKTYIITSVLIALAALAGFYWFGGNIQGLKDEGQEFNQGEKMFYVGKVGNQNVHLSYMMIEGVASNCKYVRDFVDTEIQECELSFSDAGYFIFKLTGFKDYLVGTDGCTDSFASICGRDGDFRFDRTETFNYEDFLEGKGLKSPNLITFQTKKGELDIVIQNSTNFPIEKVSKQSYKLHEDPLRSYFVEHYSDVSLKNKIDYTRKGDGVNPGEGCKIATSQTKVGELTLQHVECYYNPIDSTDSGDYISGVSDVLHTDCVYWIDESRSEALYFWANAELGHNTCEYIKRDIKVLYKK